MNETIHKQTNPIAHFTAFNRESPHMAKQVAVSSLPSIVISNRQSRDIIREAKEVLVAANNARIAKGMIEASELPLLFTRGGCIVGLELNSGWPCLLNLNATHIFGLLLRAAEWFTEETDDHGNVTRSPAVPPSDVVMDIITFPPSGLAELDSVVTTPVFGRDGTLLSSPGYHASDRLWIHAAPRLSAADVPAAPTAADVAQRRALREEA